MILLITVAVQDLYIEEGSEVGAIAADQGDFTTACFI